MYYSNSHSQNQCETVTNEIILELKKKIEKEFTESDWAELGLVVNSDHIISNHPRLLRSLSWGDDDYGACIIDVLKKIRAENPTHIQKIKDYLTRRDTNENNLYISHELSKNNITFSPSVFRVPEIQLQEDLVAVMMPFSGYDGVYNAIRNAAEKTGLKCLRADDIWQNTTIIQDIFDLIFRARIVIVDLSGKNPNVMYETGIAHTLGKLVIPLAQSISDVPSDMIHHRALIYLKNGEGLKALENDLYQKLTNLVKT